MRHVLTVGWRKLVSAFTKFNRREGPEVIAGSVSGVALRVIWPTNVPTVRILVGSAARWVTWRKDVGRRRSRIEHPSTRRQFGRCALVKHTTPGENVPDELPVEQAWDPLHLFLLEKQSAVDPVMVEVRMNGAPVRMEVDTGAVVSVMNVSSFNRVKVGVTNCAVRA